MLIERGVVLGQVAAGEDTGVDRRVEGLDAAIEHLGEARDLLDAGDRDTGRFDGPFRAAGRDELPAEGVEPPGEILDPGLVVNA